jgi:hypothetical protein
VYAREWESEDEDKHTGYLCSPIAKPYQRTLAGNALTELGVRLVSTDMSVLSSEMETRLR